MRLCEKLLIPSVSNFRERLFHCSYLVDTDFAPHLSLLRADSVNDYFLYTRLRLLLALQAATAVTADAAPITIVGIKDVSFCFYISHGELKWNYEVVEDHRFLTCRALAR